MKALPIYGTLKVHNSDGHYVAIDTEWKTFRLSTEHKLYDDGMCLHDEIENWENNERSCYAITNDEEELEDIWTQTYDYRFYIGTVEHVERNGNLFTVYLTGQDGDGFEICGYDGTFGLSFEGFSELAAEDPDCKSLVIIEDQAGFKVVTIY